MYHVKGKGKDGYRFYSDSMSIDTANRLNLERDLRQALERLGQNVLSNQKTQGKGT